MGLRCGFGFWSPGVGIAVEAGGLFGAAGPEGGQGAVSQSLSAESCARSSPPALVQNFSLPLTRRLIWFTVDSIKLLVMGRPARRYVG